MYIVQHRDRQVSMVLRSLGKSYPIIDVNWVCRLGALAPFSTKAELDTFTHLELFMRNTNQEKDGFTVLGRDHMAYRGYHVPVQSKSSGITHSIMKQSNTK